MADSNRGACVLAGALAPFFVAGAMFAWQGEGSLSRLGAMGGQGAAFGVGVLLVTLVVPCALLGLLSRGSALRAFLVGLLLPLGILAVDGLRVATEGAEEMDGAATPLRESIRVVWRPVASLDRAPAPVAAAPTGESKESPAAGEDVGSLSEQVRLLTGERDRLRVALAGVEQFGPPEVQRVIEEQKARIQDLQAQRDDADRARTASEAEIGRLRGMLTSAEQGILTARTDEDAHRKEVIDLKDQVQTARDEAAFEKKDLLAHIAALEGRDVEERIDEIRKNAFASVGIVFEVAPREMGGGLAIQTSVDAGRVHGTGLVISARGVPLAVISFGVGKGEKLSARVLFSAPRGKITPGDVVFARIR